MLKLSNSVTEFYYGSFLVRGNDGNCEIWINSEMLRIYTGYTLKAALRLAFGFIDGIIAGKALTTN